MTTASVAAPPVQPDARTDGALFAWAFGLALPIQFILTWVDGEDLWWLRSYNLFGLGIELAIIAIAFGRGMRIPLNAATASLFALAALAWTMAITAADQQAALIGTGSWTIHLLFGFAGALLLPPNILWRALVASFAATMLLLLAFGATTEPGFNWIYDLPGFHNIRSFGIFAAAIAGLAMGLAVAGRRRAPLLIAGAAFGFIFWSGTRGAVVSIVAAMAFCALPFPAWRRLRLLAMLAASAAIGLVIALVIGSPKLLFGPSRIAQTYSNGRDELWRTSWELIRDRPLFGYGEGQLWSLAHIPYTYQPHNLLLQILLAWGLAGLLLLVIPGWTAARGALRQARDCTWPYVGMAAVLLVYAMFDGSLHNSHSSSLFVACLAMVLRREPRSSPTGTSTR